MTGNVLLASRHSFTSRKRIAHCDIHTMKRMSLMERQKKERVALPCLLSFCITLGNSAAPCPASAVYKSQGKALPASFCSGIVLVRYCSSALNEQSSVTGLTNVIVVIPLNWKWIEGIKVDAWSVLADVFQQMGVYGRLYKSCLLSVIQTV